MNLPNKLTILRIILTFVFMFFLFSKGVCAKAIALSTFCLASFTDYLDGRIARSRNLVTGFGKLMDPIADKILVLAAFLAFVELKLVPAWMVVIIIARELLITGLRFLSATRGKIIAAEKEGKHKTVSQIFAIFAILIFLFAREIAGGLWTENMQICFLRIIFYIMLVVVALTIISGFSYLKRNRRLLF